MIFFYFLVGVQVDVIYRRLFDVKMLLILDELEVFHIAEMFGVFSPPCTVVFSLFSTSVFIPFHTFFVLHGNFQKYLVQDDRGRVQHIRFPINRKMSLLFLVGMDFILFFDMEKIFSKI